MSNIVALKGQGRDCDRAGELCGAIVEMIERDGQGMSIATILGVLELAKMAIVASEVPE